MQLSQLEYFITVAENLSFTKASRLLHISQPAISQQISRLEDELGFPLFVRDNRGTRLTEQGRLLLSGSKIAVDILSRTVAEAAESYRGIKQYLDIGYIDELNVHLFFPSLIHGFEKKYPNITISTKRYNFRDFYKRMSDQSIDVGFTLSFAFSDRNNFEHTALIRERTYIALSRYSDISIKEGEDPFEKLKNIPLIMISPRESPEGYAHSMNMLRDKYNFIPVEVIEAENFETQFLYTASGMGFSMLDPTLQSFYSSNLRVYPLNEEEEDKLVAVWAKDNKNLALKSFIPVLRSYNSVSEI